MKDEPPSTGSSEPADPGVELSSGDDAALLELLLTRPDRLHPGIVLWADGRVLPESDPGRRTVAGWHRAGGPVLLGLTTGACTGELLLESLRLAAAAEGAGRERWTAALESFWRHADRELRGRVGERWGLKGPAIESPEAWTSQAWGALPVEGGARTGVIAARVPEGLRRSIEWLARRSVQVAAWEVVRQDADEVDGFRLERVAGRWEGPGERSLPADDDERRRRTYVRHTGGVTAELLAALESHCRSIGCSVAWSDEEWVRFDGPARALRVFPGTTWIDLQFVGADEGTLIGLRFRHGVPVGSEPTAGAPPGVHLRLSRPEDLGPEVRALVSAWLAERSSEDRGEEGEPISRRPGRERGPSPGRGRRNRSR